MPDRALIERVPAMARDIGLALAVTGTQLTIALREPTADARPLSDLGHLGTLLLLAGLALTLRRRWPASVFVLTVVASTLYYVLEFPEGPAMVACWAAAYSLTAFGDGRRSIIIAGVAIGAMTVAWLTLGSDAGSQDTLGWLLFRIASPGLFAALGESVRSRRVITADALARAALAEQTREEEARARVNAERLRIAREVHDTVAHAIAVINVQSGVTAHVLAKQPDRARETLEAIESMSSRALREMRTILGVLRDPLHDRAPHPGLAQLDELADTAREAGLDIAVRSSLPPDPLPSAVDGAGYRIVQEAITNVIRHAGPTRVRVEVDHDVDELQVRVVNDRGHLTSPRDTQRSEPGRGILGMRERCELLGGELTAGPDPEGGFEVRAHLPLTPVAAVLG